MGESTTYRGTLGSGEAGGTLGSIGSLGTENVQFEEALFLLAAPTASPLGHWLHLKPFPCLTWPCFPHLSLEELRREEVDTTEKLDRRLADDR